MDYEAPPVDALTAMHRDAKRLRWIYSWMIFESILSVLGVFAFRETQVQGGEPILVSFGRFCLRWAPFFS